MFAHLESFRCYSPYIYARIYGLAHVSFMSTKEIVPMPELLHEGDALSVLLPSFETSSDMDAVADAWDHLAEWLDYDPDSAGELQSLGCCDGN